MKLFSRKFPSNGCYECCPLKTNFPANFDFSAFRLVFFIIESVPNRWQWVHVHTRNECMHMHQWVHIHSCWHIRTRRMYDSNNNDAVALLFIIVDQMVVWAYMHICVCVVLAKAGCVCKKMYVSNVLSYFVLIWKSSFCSAQFINSISFCLVLLKIFVRF